MRLRSLKPLKEEDLPRLGNHKLNHPNLELRIEVLNPERDKLRHERDAFIEALFRSYGVDRE